jgi:hypothetical protein
MRTPCRSLFFLSARIMCRAGKLHCMAMIDCFILHVMYWGLGTVRWWTFFLDRDNGIVQWWLIISSFHDYCCLHCFRDDSVIISCQFSFALFRLFSLVHIATEHRSIVNDDFTSYIIPRCCVAEHTPLPMMYLFLSISPFPCCLVLCLFS